MKAILQRARFTGPVLVLLLAGCWGAKEERPPAFPVRGKVLVNGRPAAGAIVVLHAMSDTKLAGLCPHALVEPDGSFRLTTYRSEDGAPAGTYALTLTWALPPRPGLEEGPDRFRGRYADPRRPVCQVEITAGPNDLDPVQLK
jgi:hypothetical protein